MKLIKETARYGMDLLLKRIIGEYIPLLLIFISLAYATTDFYTSTPQQTQNEQTDTSNNVVLEGNCVVVCDADSLPEKSRTNTFRAEYRQEKRIAFTAIRNEDNMNIDKDGIITFDFVRLNHGNAYNKQTSTFTAPVNGVYMFEFTVFKHLNRSYSLTIALTINGNQMFVAYADENSSNHEMARNSGLVGLDVGDFVRIEILVGTLDGGWQKSTFSGYLVYENMY